MAKTCNELCLCPLEGIIDIIAKKWSLLIINVLGNNEKLRFKDLMNELKGISPKTLSDSLKKLEEEKLIQREYFAEIPPRVEYSLGKDGKSLRKSIIPLLQWSATRENSKKEECPPNCSKAESHHIRNP